MEGVIRIGAVNCQDDFMLCRQQNIRSYPSVIYYGPDGTVNRFETGEKQEERLLQFVVDKLPDVIVKLNRATYKSKTTKISTKSALPWVILYCTDDDFKCPEKYQRRLLAHTLDGLVNFGVADCTVGDWCEEHTAGVNGVIYYATHANVEANDGRRIQPNELMREMAKNILGNLPDVQTLDADEYRLMLLHLEDGDGSNWLVSFVFGEDGATINEKKIPPQLPKIKFARVDCNNMARECRELKIKTPRYVLFKRGGGHEIHYGRPDAPDVVEFARVSSQARTMRTLSDSDLSELTAAGGGGGVFVDFFAPWCPPCLNLLPEFRKASINVGGSIVFGTLDCTAYPHACNKHNIR